MEVDNVWHAVIAGIDRPELLCDDCHAKDIGVIDWDAASVNDRAVLAFAILHAVSHEDAKGGVLLKARTRSC
jgi:hypothetical protein